MEAVEGHVGGVFRVGVVGLGRVEGNGSVVGIGVVVIFAGLWIFDTFVMNEMRDGELFVVIEVHDLVVLAKADGNHGVGYLLEGLAVLGFVGTPGIVLWIVDIDEVAAGHRRDEDDRRGSVEGMELVEDDPEAAIDRTVAGVVRIVVPGAQAVAMPPVVCTEKDREDIARGDLQLVPGFGEIGRLPTVMALVDVMDIGQFFDDVGEIAFGEAVFGFVGMVVEIGDAVADGYPGQGFVGEGGQDRDGGQNDKAEKLLHNGNLVKNRDISYI